MNAIAELFAQTVVPVLVPLPAERPCSTFVSRSRETAGILRDLAAGPDVAGSPGATGNPYSSKRSACVPVRASCSSSPTTR